MSSQKLQMLVTTASFLPMLPWRRHLSFTFYTDFWGARERTNSSEQI